MIPEFINPTTLVNIAYYSAFEDKLHDAMYDVDICYKIYLAIQ